MYVDESVHSPVYTRHLVPTININSNSNTASTYQVYWYVLVHGWLLIVRTPRTAVPGMVFVFPCVFHYGGGGRVQRLSRARLVVVHDCFACSIRVGVYV